MGPSLPASVGPCRFWYACGCGSIMWYCGVLICCYARALVVRPANWLFSSGIEGHPSFLLSVPLLRCMWWASAMLCCSAKCGCALCSVCLRLQSRLLCCPVRTPPSASAAAFSASACACSFVALAVSDAAMADCARCVAIAASRAAFSAYAC